MRFIVEMDECGDCMQDSCQPLYNSWQVVILLVRIGYLVVKLANFIKKLRDQLLFYLFFCFLLLDNQRITGAIPDMLEEAVAFIRKSSRTKTMITDNG